MNELKSYTEYAVSTPTADFVIGFDFNYGEDAVNVTVDDVPATKAGYTVVYLNETTIRLSPSVVSGVVRLQRETDIDQTDHAYRAGAKFIAQTMDENFEQLRHSQQEVRDGFVKLADDTYEIIDTLNEVGQSAQAAADAAEVAAQLANNAAAQVNDKVSYEDFNNKPHNAMLDRDASAAHPTRSILDASGETQQDINDFGGAKWRNKAGGYALGATVKLANGDIVKSTNGGNTHDPNVDMTGWVKPQASDVFDESGLSQQELNNIYNKQLLTTDQFKIIIPEVDATGRLQRAFDASFEKKQKLYLIGDFNCSDTIYARFNFDGSESTLNYPQDYNKDALVLGAEKSTATTTRLSGAVCNFPNVRTTKTSGTNDWSSNPNSCAIKVVNSQEGKFNFGTTYMFAYGVYFLAWNTDANYNQINFGRHVFHKRPMTFHVDGSVSVASMNQNTLTGGRFAVSNTTSRIAGIYLMHFLITGGTLSSLNNNLILNPSVEGSADEYAMLFESQGTNISGLAYNIIIAPRLETGSVTGKKMAFRGDRVRWNRVMHGYGVEYDSVVNENGATVNTIFGSTGAMQFIGSLGNTAVGSFQNNSGVAFPTFAVYATGKTNLEMMDATANSVLYATSTNLYSRSATAKRWSLGFGNGKQEWFNASEVLLANLYAETGGLKSDYRLSLLQGIGVFGTTPPSSKRSITGKKAPTTITEQNAVIDSIVAALSAYGLVSDDRTI